MATNGAGSGVVNLSEICGELQRLSTGSEKVIKRTISDVKRRAPGWVASEVVKVYGIKKGEITPSQTGSGRTAGYIGVRGGNTVASLQLVYRGRRLTLTHFGLTPKAPPAKRRGYTEKVSVLKGSRKTLGKIKPLTKAQWKNVGRNRSKDPSKRGTKSSDKSPVMLLRTGGTYIPFQRMSSARNDLEPKKTISVPQMVDPEENERTGPAIVRTLNENIEKRFTHHMERLLRG